jgi:hypothetical protein
MSHMDTHTIRWTSYSLVSANIISDNYAVPICVNSPGSAFCIQNLFVFSVAFAGVFAIVMCVIAGFMFAFGDSKTVERAKEIVKTTLVALVVAFSVYVLLSAIDPALTSFKQVEKPAEQEQVQEPEDLTAIEPRCDDCVNVVDIGIPVAEWSNVYVNKSLASKLKALYDLNKEWRITEAYPPTVEHISSCHRNGTCVDIGVYPRIISATRVSNLCEDAKAVSLDITNEYFGKNLNSEGSECPKPAQFETTSGGHLHIK